MSEDDEKELLFSMISAEEYVQQLRNDNPSLMDAWEKYNIVLALYESANPKTTTLSDIRRALEE